MTKNLLALAAATALFAHGAAHADTFSVTAELPGVQNSTSTFTHLGVETFTGRSSNFTTDYGTDGAISATYSGVQINHADQYGGAGGSGNYAVTFSTSGYTLNLSTDTSKGGPAGINYFGYWLSALDSGNQVEFYRGSEKLYTYNPTDVLAKVGGAEAYFGNPNAAFQGQNHHEPYVFLNFYDTDGGFDRVVFRENPQRGGYESDNHTVGFYTSISGTVVTPVPEPGTWAMMAAGLGSLVFVGRRRRA